MRQLLLQKETDDIPYNDKSHKLFYNSSAFAKAKNDEVRATGLAEGRATGSLEGKIQVAKNLLKTDMKIETIAQCCQLPIEKIKELQKEA